MLTLKGHETIAERRNDMITIEIKGKTIEEVAMKMIRILKEISLTNITDGKENSNGNAVAGDQKRAACAGNGPV